MKTTYFANIRKLSPEDQERVVAISRGVPLEYNGKRYDDLAPEWASIQAFKSNKDFSRFSQNYKYMILRNLDVEQVYNELGSDAILVCWERDPAVCHRSIAAEWISEGLDIEVPEIQIKPFQGE